MSGEYFLSLCAEFISCAKDLDCIIQRLGSDLFPAGMQSSFDEGMHIGFGDVLYWNVNPVFPCSKGFIVTCGNESFIFITEGKCVDRCEMVIVFLYDFACSDVVLEDLLVGETDKEFVLVFDGGIETDTVRHGAHVPSTYYFTSFGIP